MQISYKRLWKLLIDLNMNRKELRAKTGISSACIAKMGKGENISTDIIVRICSALDCDITDILELVDENGVPVVPLSQRSART
nr:helix-turn-helix transcriptional regulator [Clostridia bacterium]